MSEHPPVSKELVEQALRGSEAERCRAVVATALADAFDTSSVLEFLTSSSALDSAPLRRAHVTAFAHLVRLRGRTDVECFLAAVQDISQLYQRTRDQDGAWQDAADDASVFAPRVLEMLVHEVGVIPR